MQRSGSIARGLLGFLALAGLLAAASVQAQTLGAGTNFAAGTNPTSVAVGDVNRDGRSDLVVTNGTPGTISVLLATGDGTFGAPTSFAVGARPVAVALGDLNRDGILDAVVANADGNSISVLLGNTTGGFGAQAAIPVGVSPTAVAIGDLDGDGRLDVVVTNGVAGTVTVLRGNGTGGLSLVGDFATGPFPSSVALADTNGGGRLDVIVGSRDGGMVSVFPNVGGGLLGPRLDLAAGGSIVGLAVGDVNLDGRPDIAVADAITGALAVQRSDGSGGFRRTESNVNLLQAAVAVALADFDGDGRADLVLVVGGTTLVLRGLGDGTFTVASSATSALAVSAIAVGDFDRDGLPDVVTALPGFNVVSLRLNTTVPAAAGAFRLAQSASPRSFVTDAQPIALLIGDVLSTRLQLPAFDGVLDAVVVDADEINVGPQMFLGSVPPALAGGATAAALADLNGDGRPDIVLGRSAGVSVRFNSPQSNPGFGVGFAPPIDSGGGFSAPTVMVAGDIDRDGIPDLVVANAESSSVVVLRGSRTGTFTSTQFVGLGTDSFPSALALADLDRNGTLDLLVAHANGISVFLGTGTGTFGTATNFAAGLSPLDLAVGDIDRDGRLDVVFTSANDGAVRTMLGGGNGTFGAPVTFSGFTAPSAVALADVNRDGALDLVVLDGGAGSVVVRTGFGNGNFAAPTIVPAGSDPVAFALGDVDRDGRLDLLVLSAARELRVLLNDGAGAGTIALFSQAALTLVEGNDRAFVGIPVVRSGGTAPATVELTLAGSAVLGVDYEARVSGSFTALPASSTLTFAQGETRKDLVLSPVFRSADSLVTANRTIVLTLGSPGGGAILGTPVQQTVTLVERDEALSFSQANFPVTEGGEAAVTVVRRGDLTGTVTVGYKTVAGSATGPDFVSTTGSLTFPPGVAQQTFVVKTKADAAREADEALALVLTAPKSTVVDRVIQLEAPSVAQLTVLDANSASVSFATATATVAEGASTTVTLVRSGALTETVTARVGNIFLSAFAADFTLTPAAPASIVFGPGVTTQTLQVAATADATVEGPESFLLTLSEVTSGGRPGRVGATSVMTVTILDDESAFSFADAFTIRELPESMAAATFTVMRTGSLTGTATVQVRTIEGVGGGTAVPGQDYQPLAPTTTLTFAPGVATRTFTVPLLNDTVVDGSKTLRVALVSATGGPAIGTQSTSTVTLLDDDDAGVIQWQKAATTVTESAGTAVLTVTRTLSTPGKHLASGVAVAVTRTGGTATAGADFTLPVGILTFAAGQAMQTVSVPITADTLDESAETVVLTLSNPQGGATLGGLVTTTLTITDDDEPGQIQFATASATVDEESLATTTVRVTRTGTKLASAVTVKLAVTGGTAQLGVDFTLPTGTLTFAAGEATKDLTLGRISDGKAEGPETIVLTLADPTGGATLGGQRTMLITLTGVESAVGFTLPGFAASEGTATATLTVLRTGPLTAAATVQVRTVDGLGGGTQAVPGLDYLPVPPTTLTFAPGTATRTVTIPILNNTRRDGPRTVALLLEAPSAGLALGTQRSTVLTIADNDAGGTIGFTTGTMTVSDAAGVANVTVKRTGGVAGGVSVDYVASFSDATSFFGSRRQTGTLFFGPGQTSRTITLALSTDPLIRGERVFVELGNVTGGAALGNSRLSITVTDKDVGGTVRLATSALTVVEGTTAVVTVLRTGGLAGGVRVPFTMFDGTTGGFSARNGLDFVLDSGAVVFEEGETTKTIAIPIFADALLEGPETFKLFLSTPSGGGTLGTPSTMLVTIVDPEAAVGFDRGFVQVDELTPAVTVTALRSGPLTGTATVQFRTIEGTGAGNAVPDVDYRPVQKTLTFAAGVATQTVTIPLLNDTTVDGQRTVRLELSNAVGVALGTAQRTMNITITDNEFGGTIELADSQFVASEAAGVATVRVLRTLPSIFGVNSPALGGGVVVNFTATAQSASLGSDFTIASGAVTFTGTETTKDIVIPIVGDGVAEGPESFVVTLQSVTGGGSLGLIRAATVTIVD